MYIIFLPYRLGDAACGMQHKRICTFNGCPHIVLIIIHKYLSHTIIILCRLNNNYNKTNHDDHKGILSRYIKLSGLPYITISRRHNMK